MKSFLQNFNSLKKLNYIQEITIAIKGSGNQYILNYNLSKGYSFKSKPSEIIINKIVQNYTDYIVYNLKEEENIITMKWNYSLETCVGMFYTLSNITKVDLSKFDFSKVTSMFKMFDGCTSLTSINFFNINTSSINDMGCLFFGCNITFIDISGFDTSKVTNMSYMFTNCKSLISLDLSNFNTSSVKTMEYMFDHCFSLLSLDLNNFDTSLVISMNNMFYYCIKLVSLNINNFHISNLTNFDKFIEGSNKDLILCLDDSIDSKFISIINSTNNNYKNDCSDICFNKSKKIKSSENPICLLNCDDDYIFEYNNICYKSCPIGTHNSTTKNNFCEKDIDEHDENIENIKNIDSIQLCDSVGFLSNLCQINDNSSNEKDNMIEKIRNKILDGSFDYLISNNIEINKEDLIAKGENIIYQLTSCYNQNNNEYKNISTIKLGECETKLKKFYHFNNNETLIILKVDYFEQGLLIPIIEYEVYEYKSRQKLDLNICRNEKINISIPVTIDEDNLFKYNSSSEYYNDFCFPYTTENNTDIILNDRKNEFKEKNLSLCESNCDYNGYNSNKKIALCECFIKIKFPFIKEIIVNKDKLLNNFINLKETTNIKTIKCLDLIFSKEGLISNIGFYIILTIIILDIILAIIFKIKGFNTIHKKINQIFKIKIMKTNKTNLNLITKKSTKKLNINKINLKNRDNNGKNKINIYKKRLTSKTLKNKNKNNPPKIQRNKTSVKKLVINGGINFNMMNISYGLSGNSYSEFELKKNNNKNIIEKKKDIIINKNKILKYNDYELNILDYKEALKIDKRTFFQYYISLIKRKQILIFTFYTRDDYNSKIIKISLFLITFSLYLSINSLFFTESTIHKIYEDNGSFNFIYQIPQIIYSTLICSLFNILFRILSLSEKNIIEVKTSKQKKHLTMRISKIIKCLIIKFIFFYIFSFLLLLVFWYYLMSFCAVYKNSQIHLITDTLISYLISLLTPFGLCLLPGIFRIPSLNSSNKNRKCLYDFSKILELVI